MKKSRKNMLSTIILILVFLVGLSLLLYPTVSDYWNSLHQSKAISDYTEYVTQMDDETYEKILEAAQEYNSSLVHRSALLRLSDAELQEYKGILSVPGTDVIGYIEISKIDCYLPIYHGTDETVLRSGVGHIEGSSLPVGGESTHCVLSGHRGLPSAKLFTDLDQLETGDTFVINVLDETLTYEVDQIRIVEPQGLGDLGIVEGEDYCTLVTCTPYGINTHRLLVRGHRVDNAESDGSARVTSDAIQIEPIVVAPVVAVPILILLFIGLMVKSRRRRSRKSRK